VAPYRLHLTAEGQRHPVTSVLPTGTASLAAWDELPAASGVNLVRAKPGATVLLDHPGLLVDGKPVSGCLTLAVFLDGADLVTVEHLATPGKLDPVQQAFIECGAFQCGYCTPGFVLMAKALLGQYSDPDNEQIRDYLSGNLCRCAAYPEIVNAVKMAARKNKAGSIG